MKFSQREGEKQPAKHDSVPGLEKDPMWLAAIWGRLQFGVGYELSAPGVGSGARLQLALGTHRQQQAVICD